jgi:hypothetical protein
MAVQSVTNAGREFKKAQFTFQRAGNENMHDMALGFMQLAFALENLADGVGETYEKLEQIEALIKKQRRPPEDLRSWLE